MRKFIRSGLACVFLLLAAAEATAVEVRYTPLEITGFMDVLFSTDNPAPGERNFHLGQAELDIAACLASHTCTCVAVAYDPETGTFGLGTATVTFLLAGSGSDCRHHYRKWERSGVTVGMFDVPFGIDWLTYASVDRRTITAPVAVAATHDSWNDVGAMAFIEARKYTLRAWLVNGADVELPDADPLVLATDGAVGARASVLPVEGVELGASAATFNTTDDAQSMSLVGFDVQASRGPWAVKGEYVARRLDFGGGADLTDDGWYAQATRDFNRWYLFGRWDKLDAETSGTADLEYLGFGLGVGVASPAELRVEYRSWQGNTDAGDDTWLAQLVTAF